MAQTLNCTLHGYYFNEILQGRKRNEYRDNTPFWRTRLFNADGSPKKYKTVTFRNGYAADAPLIEIEFKGVTECDCFDIALGNIVRTDYLTPKAIARLANAREPKSF